MPFDILIALLAGLTQVGLGWLGVRMTTKPPRTKAQKRGYELGFIALSFVGVLAIIGTSYRASEAQDRAERLAEKNQLLLERITLRVEYLAGFKPQNTAYQLPNRPATKPPPKGGDSEAGAAPIDGLSPATGTVAEDALFVEPGGSVPRPPPLDAKQRMELLAELRNLWIASHDGISSEMLAGLEWPPEQWLNDQLFKYRQPWRVKVSGPRVEAYDPAP
jgi:hypothetical protein